ncbi:MAG: helix-turn-helix transcriptional regulator [Clostridia bacterium]|nr:helix-turn-helix transcriptional regulator [Clostridia bacterium]
METKKDAAFLITEFSVRHMKFDTRHLCDGSAGKLHTSFGYIVKGCDTLTTEHLTLELKEGSFFYLPDGIRYRSEWKGSPSIEYYMLHMTFAKGDDRKFEPAEIAPLSGPETLAVISRIEEGLSGGEGEQFGALSSLYRLVARAFPYLKPWEKPEGSPALKKAVEYLKENYARDFSMAELAGHCFLSESRLYHLFDKELKISPLRLRNEIRVNRAMAMLRTGEVSLREILAETGFSSEAYFRKIFKEQTGMTLSEYVRMLQK